MITYQRDHQQTIPDSEVIIVGVGGAGANIIDRVALDGMESAQQLALNTDSRTLNGTVAKQKVQMGPKLTRGLGCGGDPELGLQAAMEVEDEIRDALRGHKMVFVCVGLGGGTGSGAAPLVTRLARELGAFVVVFGTMPFNFEGRRRREQAETSLNELSVLANALVTFDNGRMGELVLASQGIHEAFAAADNMISESIRAVTRLVIKPGLINVGLDDLMSSLKATRSRCLFGSGLANGENRSQTALKNALNSPLLDKGRLLKNTQTALVHVCGGGEMTLYEVELLMQELTKVVPKDAHILFGAAVDDSMGDSLSVTIISSLPEEHVIVNESEEIAAAKKPNKSEAKNVASTEAQATPVAKVSATPVAPSTSKAKVSTAPVKPVKKEVVAPVVPTAPVTKVAAIPVVAIKEDKKEEVIDEPVEEEVADEVEAIEPEPELIEEEVPVVEERLVEQEEIELVAEEVDDQDDEEELIEEEDEVIEEEELIPEPEPEPELVVAPDPVRAKRKGIFSNRKKPQEVEEPEIEEEEIIVEPPVVPVAKKKVPPLPPMDQEPAQVAPKIKLNTEAPEILLEENQDADKQQEQEPVAKTKRVRAKTPKPSDAQGELLLDGGPRGKFEGEAPNIVDGEDLDIPPFLRNRK